MTVNPPAFALALKNAKFKQSQSKRAVSLPRMARTQVLLDMGEASREEGFRLNGCR